MLFIVIMMVITVMHATGRYVFDKPILGLVELSVSCLVIAASLVIPYSEALGRHITIGIIVDHFSQRGQAIVSSVSYILSLAFASVALWQAIVRGTFLVQHRQVSAILEIPDFPFLYIVAFGWGVFGLSIAMHLIYAIIRGLKR